MARRKQHSGESGYVAERINPHVPGKKVVIYRAAEQTVDVYGMQFAIVCDAHSQVGGAMTIKIARANMKNPGEFCTECRRLEPELV